MTNFATARMSHRLLAAVTGALLAGGVVTGLTACNGGAQSGPNQQSPTPTSTPTPSIFPTPVPTSSDDSGTLGG